MQRYYSYPAVSLSEASKLKAESRALLAEDIDPQEELLRDSQETNTNTIMLFDTPSEANKMHIDIVTTNAGKVVHTLQDRYYLKFSIGYTH